MAGSADMTARVFSLDPIEGFTPFTLAGHRDEVVGVYFADDDKTISSLQQLRSAPHHPSPPPARCPPATMDGAQWP